MFLPCNFLLWNLGLPRKLFLIFVKRVFHNCPPGALQGEPGGTTALLFIKGEAVGFITVKETLKTLPSLKYLKKLTTICLWIMKHAYGNCGTWIGTVMYCWGAIWSSRTSRWHTAGLYCWWAFMTWITSFTCLARFTCGSITHFNSSLWGSRGCTTHRGMMHRAGTFSIPIGGMTRWVTWTSCWGWGPWNDIGLLLGCAQRWIATCRTVIWGGTHWGYGCGWTSLMMWTACATVRTKAVYVKYFQQQHQYTYTHSNEQRKWLAYDSMIMKMFETVHHYIIWVYY